MEQNTQAQYNDALTQEGEFWDNFVLQRLMRGEIPGSIDWRLTFSQFRYNHNWAPLALGPQLANFRMREINYLLRTAAPRPGLRVLDLGCGAGWLSLELARRGAHVTGLDISPTNLALGRYMAETNARNYPYLYQGFAGLNCTPKNFGSVEYMYADLNAVNLPPNEYDAVVTWDALHHVAELERLLEQVRAALKPGGIFLGLDHSFATPRTHIFNNNIAPWVRQFYSWVTTEDPKWLYTSANTSSQRMDLGVLSVDYNNTPVPGWREFSRDLLSEMGEVIRNSPGEAASPLHEDMLRESPFEDVSAQRLMRTLYSRFAAGRFETVCPFISPESLIPHYRNEDERIFQHYLAAAMVNAGEQAIRLGQADGQWFVFTMSREEPYGVQEPAWLAKFGVDEAAEALKLWREDGVAKEAYINTLEAQIAAKNKALAEMEARLKQREGELRTAREPHLPWKRRKHRV